MLPDKISCSQSDEYHAQLMLSVSPHLFWFKGHFPLHPILPGVAQVDWAVKYGCELLAKNFNFAGIENVKFQKPLRPGNTVKLVLTWLPERQILDFKYVNDSADLTEEQIYSSGKIRLCQ